MPRVPDFTYRDLSALGVAILYNSTEDIETFLNNGCDVNYDGVWRSEVTTKCENPLFEVLNIPCKKQIIYAGYTPTGEYFTRKSIFCQGPRQRLSFFAEEIFGNFLTKFPHFWTICNKNAKFWIIFQPIFITILPLFCQIIQNLAKMWEFS